MLRKKVEERYKMRLPKSLELEEVIMYRGCLSEPLEYGTIIYVEGLDYLPLNHRNLTMALTYLKRNGNLERFIRYEKRKKTWKK